MVTKKAKSKSTKKQSWLKNTLLYKSFQSLGHRFIHLTFLDFLYYLTFALVGSFYFYRVLPKLSILQSAQPLLEQVDSWREEGVFQELTDIERSVAEFKIYTALVLGIIFLSYIIIKWVISTLMQDKKLQKVQFVKFTILNLIFASGFITLTAILYSLFQEAMFAILFVFIMVPLTIYLVNNLHPIFVNNKNIFQSYIKAFSTFKKIHYFIIPYIVIFIIFIAIYILLSFLNFIPDTLFLLIFLLIFACYITWAKVYLLSILKKIKSI
jgi:hypothetical protein